MTNRQFFFPSLLSGEFLATLSQTNGLKNKQNEPLDKKKNHELEINHIFSLIFTFQFSIFEFDLFIIISNLI
jgi:hypothetical protein